MKIWFTITGTSHWNGHGFMKPGMNVRLEKEPDNAYDREAIKVSVAGIGQVGYVANSPYTVVGECFSAGRLYDRIGDKAEGTVRYVLPKAVVCTVRRKSLLGQGRDGGRGAEDKGEDVSE